MKPYLGLLLLGLSQTTNAQLSADISPNSVSTRFCSQYGLVSSCLQSKAREEGIDTLVTIESQVAGTRLRSTFQETDKGLAAGYELRNNHASLRTDTLDGRLRTTSLLTRAKDWKIGLRYEHEQEKVNATLQKDDFSIHYNEENVRAQYQHGNWQFRTAVGRTDYSAAALFKLRF